jgi:hypothetical protein
LAASTDDQKVAAALVAMAEEFSSTADEFDPGLTSNSQAATEDRNAGRVG